MNFLLNRILCVWILAFLVPVVALSSDLFPSILELSDGRSFDSPKPLKIEKDTVKIMHSGGITTIPINLLPKDVQNKIIGTRPQVSYEMKPWGKDMLSAPQTISLLARQTEVTKVDKIGEQILTVEMTDGPGFLLGNHPDAEIFKLNYENIDPDKTYHISATANVERLSDGSIKVALKKQPEVTDSITLELFNFGWLSNTKNTPKGAKNQNVAYSFKVDLSNSRELRDFFTPNFCFQIPDTEKTISDESIDEIFLCFTLTSITKPTHTLGFYSDDETLMYNFGMRATAKVLGVTVVQKKQPNRDALEAELNRMTNGLYRTAGNPMDYVVDPSGDLKILASIQLAEEQK